MIALIQRVTFGKVEVDGGCIAQIQRGVVALVAVQSGDTTEKTQRLLTRVLNYRIFPDEAGKMNLSVMDVNGGLMLVPQFTLLADTNRGNRPSFSKNVPAEIGKQYFTQLIAYAKQQYSNIHH